MNFSCSLVRSTWIVSHQKANKQASKSIMRVSMVSIHLLFYSSLQLVMMTTSAVDTINNTRSIRDGETLVSDGGSFELGFFSPGSSRNRYLGIWYKRVSVMTVVWVANREIPLTDSSGVLKITDQGTLHLLNHNGSTIWSTNTSRTARNPVALLLDSGNLVVKDEGDDNLENSLWQSFDYPCDTLLPGMKLGWNRTTGLERYLSSWKSPDDPARGNFTFRLDPNGYPEVIMKENSIERFRAGPWNGLRFTGTPELKPNQIYTYGFVFNEKEISYIYQLRNSSLLSRLVLNENGLVQRFTWIDRTNGWVVYLSVQIDTCDRYALCGAYGSCNINNSPGCDCLKGFVPRVQKEWNMVDWSSGCVRKTPLNCSGDGFRKYSGLKLPETRRSWFNESMDLEECKEVCMKNCSCTAYANLDIRNGGSGCLLWFGNLIDIREFSENGQEIYIRMAASELDQSYAMSMKSSGGKKTLRITLITLLSAGMFLLVLVLVLHVWKKKQQKQRKMTEDLELPLFDLGTIACATNNFSEANKVGEGGFGPVYKGILKDGQEIAVKRLSKTSSQGLDEFKNEVLHVSKLQHRNLVKLLGCCIQADEKMLIYEFMPNKSLDFFIFDEKQQMLLDWPRRYCIINGIARGLLYLHQDSRLRIVHRDLKASNILLDYEMNPRISDFGLARSFGGNESEANTKKVVGTYGYMSPEYAIDGLYSVKSDVFSFGVMVLEIVSGRKNRGFSNPEHHLNLLGHAWKLHKEGRDMELIAAPLRHSCNLSEVLRSVQIGLLCVQRSPEDRPLMSSVVLMFAGEGTLPQPKQPGFFAERDFIEEPSSSSSTQKMPWSANDLTLTLMEAR